MTSKYYYIVSLSSQYTFVQPAQLAFVAMCTLWASSRDAGRLPSWRCVAPTLLVLSVGALILAIFPLMGVGFYVFPKDYCTMDTEWYVRERRRCYFILNIVYD